LVEEKESARVLGRGTRFAYLPGPAEDLLRMIYAPSREPVEQARLARPRN